MFARLILSVALCAAVVLRAQEPLPATLRVTCEPAAALWVNHKPNKTGENFNLTLPPNTPTVLRVSAPGHVTQWRTVTLRAGERRHEPFRLAHEPIPVLFRSERPATVLCDGAELGETPFHCFFDEPRAYRVVIRAEGYQDQAIRLDLSNGKPRVVDANLVADSGTLKIVSAPAGAKVQVNGIAHGVTPCDIGRLREGKHTIRLTLDGYRPVSHEVDLRAGETIPVTLDLRRLPAGLTVTTIPEGARVYVDGAYRGNSDLTLADLNQGRRQARQISKQGRGLGVAIICVWGICASYRLDVAVCQHGVQFFPLGVGIPAGGHICPGRKEDQPTGLEPPFLFQSEGKLQSQVSPCGVSRQDHIFCAPALVHEIFPGFQAVFQGGGVGKFGGQAILEG